MLGCFLEHLVRIYIFRSPTQLSCSVSSRGPRRLRGGGTGGKDTPSYQAPEACIIPWGGAGGVLFSRPPAGERVGVGVGEGTGVGWYGGQGRHLAQPGSEHQAHPTQRAGPLKHAHGNNADPPRNAHSSRLEARATAERWAHTTTRSQVEACGRTRSRRETVPT